MNPPIPENELNDAIAEAISQAYDIAEIPPFFFAPSLLDWLMILGLVLVVYSVSSFLLKRSRKHQTKIKDLHGLQHKISDIDRSDVPTAIKVSNISLQIKHFLGGILSRDISHLSMFEIKKLIQDKSHDQAQHKTLCLECLDLLERALYGNESQGECILRVTALIDESIQRPEAGGRV